MKYLNKLLISTFFLSSIVAAAVPVYSKGDTHVGVRTAFGSDIYGAACYDLGMGHLTSRALYWCYSHHSYGPGQKAAPSFTETKPFSYQVDLSDVLSHTTWQLGPIYIPARREPEVSGWIYLFPILLAVTVLFGVWSSLREPDNK